MAPPEEDHPMALPNTPIQALTNQLLENPSNYPPSTSPSNIFKIQTGHSRRTNHIWFCKNNQPNKGKKVLLALDSSSITRGSRGRKTSSKLVFLQTISVIKVLYWNCREIANTPTKRVLANLVPRHSLDIIFISELCRLSPPPIPLG